MDSLILPLTHLHTELYLSVLTLIVTTVVASAMKKISTKMIEIVGDIQHSKAASRAVLHDRLYQGYQFYLRIGAITADDLENMNYMYKEYNNLNGNGTCKTLHNKVDQLPIVSVERFNLLLRLKNKKEEELNNDKITF